MKYAPTPDEDIVAAVRADMVAGHPARGRIERVAKTLGVDPGTIRGRVRKIPALDVKLVTVRVRQDWGGSIGMVPRKFLKVTTDVDT
jgi:hypothetical protein